MIRGSRSIRLLLWVILAKAAGMTIQACNSPESPEYRRLEDVKVQRIGTASYEVNGNVIYNNPNRISGTLKSLELDYWLNDLAVGKLDTVLDIEIPANSDFAIPVYYRFNVSELKLNKEVLKTLISAVLDKKVNLRYTGEADIKIAGIRFKVPIDNEEEVPFGRKP